MNLCVIIIVHCTDIAKRGPHEPSAFGQESEQEAVAESHSAVESPGKDAQDVHLHPDRLLPDLEFFRFAASAPPPDLGLPRGRRVILAGLGPAEPEGNLCAATVLQRTGTICR